MKPILITGGAGFIGSHLADELLRRGYRVRALDNISPQVHGAAAAPPAAHRAAEPAGRNGNGAHTGSGNGSGNENGRGNGDGNGDGNGRAIHRPAYLDPRVELLHGDIRDPATVRAALDGVDAVYHFAAAVGVGQSMYEVAHYTSVNNVGTAVLLEALIERPVQRLIVASSMSIYGEGLYKDPHGNISRGIERSLQQLKDHDWEIRNNRNEVLTPIPTPETKQPTLASVYALSKYDQERMCLMVGRAYEIPTVALRFFNVYGTRQSLSNPYTGVLAIFASRLLNDQPPIIFEDGYQQRDFVSVYDVAQACRLALEVPEAAGRVFNVGSGRAYTVYDIALRMAETLGKQHIAPQVTGKYRVGDIRHCFADIRLARRILGYEPRIDMEQGLAELAQWLQGQVAHDRVAEAKAELDVRGLAI